jgi:hypothetical protein
LNPLRGASGFRNVVERKTRPSVPNGPNLVKHVNPPSLILERNCKLGYVDENPVKDQILGVESEVGIFPLLKF